MPTSPPLRIIRFLVTIALGFSLLGAFSMGAGLIGTLFRAPYSIDPPLTIRIAAKHPSAWAMSLRARPDAAVSPWKVHATLTANDLPRRVQVASHMLFFSFIAAFAGTLWLLRQFLNDVVAGEIFTQRNAARLRRIGAIVVISGLLKPIAESAIASMALAHVRSDTFQLTAGSNGDGTFVFSGLFLLVLAEVWRYGVELQAERDSTV